MTSNIDPSKPTPSKAFTVDVRGNFQTAYNEISALQDAVLALQNAIANPPPGSGGGGGGVAGQVGFLITPSQLLEAASNPIVIVPPPGAGNAVILTAIFYSLNATNPPYVDSSFDYGLYYGNVYGRPIDQQGFSNIVTATSYINSFIAPATGALHGAIRGDIENAPIMLTGTAPLTGGGGGSCGITVQYIVATL